MPPAITYAKGTHPQDFCDQLNQQFEEARKKEDPFCYTDQSKSFGPKSLLIAQLGFSEETREVKRAELRKYDALLAERFEVQGLWYTPVYFLTDDDGLPVVFDGSVFLLTDPLKASQFLENWQSHFVLPDKVTTHIIYDDIEFDEFNRWCCTQDLSVLVDPILSNDPPRLISGARIIPIEAFLAMGEDSSPDAEVEG